MLFLGTFTPRLDEKGRIILPAKFRETFAPGAILTKGQERCLYVFTEEQFQSWVADLHNSERTGKAAREFERVLFSGASEEKPDKQGRVTIPPPLRTYAGLTRECTVIGVGNRLEIWDDATWQERQVEQDHLFANTDA